MLLPSVPGDRPSTPGRWRVMEGNLYVTYGNGASRRNGRKVPMLTSSGGLGGASQRGIVGLRGRWGGITWRGERLR
jgi:hypothetical protein